MAATKKSAPKTKQSAATESRRSIEAQTAAFLQSGGEIQRIANGVSGQLNMGGPRQISLAKKPTAPIVPGSVQEHFLKGKEQF